jgi:glutamine---fructose-6-phosphate transaminase (isomerizing)
MMRFGARLAAELGEAPEALRRQAMRLDSPLASFVERVHRRPPDVVLTCARGSSANAAIFAKHLIERYLGLPVAAVAPNIATIYRQRLRLKHQLFLAISQSGASDDLVEAAVMARAAGAVTVALVNDVDSDLASACEMILPMAAGVEFSVAATKTFVASLAALLRMTALWSGDSAMLNCCDRLPERIAAAAHLDWTAALRPLADAQSLIALGRGPTLAIAHEAALKLKEACTLHAEAFSSAEFRHGPIALVSNAYPVMVFAPTDQSIMGIPALIADLQGKGASVLAAAPDAAAKDALRLPTLTPEQPEADAICLIQSFYTFLIRLADRRGTDVDSPRHLQKVTRTR